MPYTPTSPPLALCEDLVDAITTGWAALTTTAPSTPNGVQWAVFNPFPDGEDGQSAIDGRQVVVFPAAADSAYATRAQDRYTMQIGVLTVERYKDGGFPPRDWVAERVDFVHDLIVQGLDFNRDGPPSWNKQLGTLSADWQLYDAEKLAGANHLFYSLVVLEFEEFVDA